MRVTSEAQEAWWPPTLSPSRLSRRWLALWMIQAESQRIFFSSAVRQARRSGATAPLSRLPTVSAFVISPTSSKVITYFR